MGDFDEYDDGSEEKIERLIENYIDRYYMDSEVPIERIRHNIWTIQEEHYTFNIIVTSILVIFDAILFEDLPDEKLAFFEELLTLNAHRAKSSKICLVKERVHLRIIRGLEDFDYSEFVSHIDEYREIFTVILDKLYYEFYHTDNEPEAS